MSLLSASRNVKNSDLAQKTYNRMKELFPDSNDVLTLGLTLLGNVYGSIGNFEKADEVRRELNQSSLKKTVGLTWTVIDGEIYVSTTC